MGVQGLEFKCEWEVLQAFVRSRIKTSAEVLECGMF